ncbi:hypothetical protein D770_22635 [Flammeovirgaceae bacterium 311]|nr:hypothetical protein D770_22635 [Flammeovirgaceae bacterium 311]
MAIGGIYAQQKQVKVNSWIESGLPNKVIAAIETGYPGINMHQHFTAAVDVVKKEKRDKKAGSWSSETYHVHYQGRNYQKKEIFDKEGNLLYSRESILNTAMPHAVLRYIGKEYNGWLVKKTAVIKITEAGAAAPWHTVQYKVLLQNGKEKQRLLLNVNGQGEIYASK